jgi:hypothetical protein
MALNEPTKPYEQHTFTGYQKDYIPPYHTSSYSIPFKASIEDIPARYKANFQVSNREIERLVELATPVYPTGQLPSPEIIFRKPEDKYISFTA